mgnify:FL=1
MKFRSHRLLSSLYKQRVNLAITLFVLCLIINGYGLPTTNAKKSNKPKTRNAVILVDSDSDGIPDNDDEFPNNALEHSDLDRDGIGNNEDLDDDADGIPDTIDNFPLGPVKNLTVLKAQKLGKQVERR